MSETKRRNSDGLIDGVDYKKKPDGSIDWRAMVRKEHLVINRQYEKQLVEKLNKPFNEITVDEVEDSKLLILLQGLKELAQLRGYTELDPKVEFASENDVIVKTRINWIGNYETDGNPVVFGGIGGANFHNTSGFAQRYLAAIAENRAFCRAVRNFLGIAIVSAEEIDKKDLKESADNTSTPAQHTPQAVLEKTMENAGISFEVLKKTLEKYTDKLEGAPASWSTIKDVPPADVLTIVGLIKKSAKK